MASPPPLLVHQLQWSIPPHCKSFSVTDLRTPIDKASNTYRNTLRGIYFMAEQLRDTLEAFKEQKDFMKIQNDDTRDFIKSILYQAHIFCVIPLAVMTSDAELERTTEGKNRLPIGLNRVKNTLWFPEYIRMVQDSTKETMESLTHCNELLIGKFNWDKKFNLENLIGNNRAKMTQFPTRHPREILIKLCHERLGYPGAVVPSIKQLPLDQDVSSFLNVRFKVNYKNAFFERKVETNPGLPAMYFICAHQDKPKRTTFWIVGSTKAVCEGYSEVKNFMRAVRNYRLGDKHISNTRAAVQDYISVESQTQKVAKDSNITDQVKILKEVRRRFAGSKVRRSACYGYALFAGDSGILRPERCCYRCQCLHRYQDIINFPAGRSDGHIRWYGQQGGVQRRQDAEACAESVCALQCAIYEHKNGRPPFA